MVVGVAIAMLVVRIELEQGGSGKPRTLAVLEIANFANHASASEPLTSDYEVVVREWGAQEPRPVGRAMVMGQGRGLLALVRKALKAVTR